jgi:uncharacterized protein (DUF1697 family)
MIDQDFTDIIVETWKTIVEYIPEKDRAKAAEHWIQTLSDNGIDEDTLDALAESDDIFDEFVKEAKDDPLYEEAEDTYGDDDEEYN